MLRQDWNNWQIRQDLDLCEVHESGSDCSDNILYGVYFGGSQLTGNAVLLWDFLSLAVSDNAIHLCLLETCTVDLC